MKMMYCPQCGTTAKPRKHTPGSFLVELVLWLFLIVPGLIYSVWRVSSRKSVCPACGNDRIVPADSPVARTMQARSAAVAPPPPPSTN